MMNARHVRSAGGLGTSRWRLLMLVVFLLAGAPTVARAQVTAADSAAVLLRTAEEFEREGETEVAAALYTFILEHFGATPAAAGQLGVIPGSMAAPGFLVRGKGSGAALHSASHGAGRAISRTQANKSLRWRDAEALLKERDITLLSAGLDEAPMVYKDIHQVMAAQVDLVEVLGRFEPKIVKMAPAGERPED